VVYARGWKPTQNKGGNNQRPTCGGVEKAKAAKSSEDVVRRGKVKILQRMLFRRERQQSLQRMVFKRQRRLSRRGKL
jgi:hypothetical protein